MTVAATTNRKTYAGDNVTTSFATSPVIFYATSDLQVRTTVIATGVSTLLTLNTHYTVTGGSAAGATGTVNLAGGSSPHGALLSTEKLVILRVLPFTQAVDFVNNNNSDAEVLEAALDKLTDVDQQLSERQDRALTFPEGDVSGSTTTLQDASVRAGRLLGFDTLGVLTTFALQVGTSLVNLAAAAGASLIGFIAAGVGAVLRTLQDKGRDIVSVKDYGAIGDGVTDDTAAWIAAVAAVVARRTQSAAGLTAGLSPAIDGCGGKYKVSATIPLDAYIEIRNAIFVPTVNTFSTFSAVQQADKFYNVKFVAGQDAIAVATGNVDTTVIDIDSCEFMNQTVTAIKTDANSGSTLLNIRKGRFYNNTGASPIMLWSRSITHANFDDSWASWSGIGFQVGDAALKQSHLEVSGLLGVPIGGSTVWINNFGFCRATKCRFGGEAAATIVQQRSSVGDGSYDSGLVIEDCETNASGKYLVEFYGIPKIFSWKRNLGATSNVANGFFFDASIGSLTLINDFGDSWEIDQNTDPVTEFRGTTEPAVRATSIRTETVRGAASLITADKILQIPSDSVSFGRVGSSSNTNTTNGTNTFGAVTRKNVGTSATYNGNTSESWPTAFNALPTGIYTVVYDIENLNDMPVSMNLFAADKLVVRSFKRGKHIICIPTYFNGTNNRGTGYQTNNINNAQNVAFGPMRIFTGVVQVDSQNTIVYGTAAPATLAWEVGDRVNQKTPTVGQPKAWVCTVAGTPGTWVSEGNL